MENIKDAFTPQEMRDEIFRLRQSNSLVCRVMDMADYQHLTGDDRYAVLAYYALRELDEARKTALDILKTQPPSGIQHRSFNEGRK